MALFSVRRLISGNPGAFDPAMAAILPLVAAGVWFERRLVLAAVLGILVVATGLFVYLFALGAFHPIHGGGLFLAIYQGTLLYRYLSRPKGPSSDPEVRPSTTAQPAR